MNTTRDKVKPLRIMTPDGALRWIRSQPGGGVSLSAAALGRVFGMRPRRVGRLLREWERRGLIERRGKLIRVLGREGAANVQVSLHEEPNTAAIPTGSSQESRQTDAPRLGAAVGLNAVLLMLIGAGLGLIGLAMNVQFAVSLGTSRSASAVFVMIGIMIDAIEVVGLGAMVSLWRTGSKAGAVSLSLVWIAAVCMTLIAGASFVSVQLSEMAAARNKIADVNQGVAVDIHRLVAEMDRLGPAVPATDDDVALARHALGDAEAARDRECVNVGPVCRSREDTVSARASDVRDVQARRAATDRQASIRSELAALRSEQAARPAAADVDPAAGFISGVVRRASLGRLALTERQVRYVRVIGLASFPPVGGLLFGLGVGLWTAVVGAERGQRGGGGTGRGT